MNYGKHKSLFIEDRKQIMTHINDESEDTLKHYGVLGMKWGHRKAAKYENKAKISRDSAKELDDIANNYDSKGKHKQAQKFREYATRDRKDAIKYDKKSQDIKNKHELRTDKKTFDYVGKQNIGKLAVESALFGTYGAMKYNQARSSKSLSVGKSAIEAAKANLKNNLTLGIKSIKEPRETAKQNAKKQLEEKKRIDKKDEKQTLNELKKEFDGLDKSDRFARQEELDLMEALLKDLDK